MPTNAGDMFGQTGAALKRNPAHFVGRSIAGSGAHLPVAARRHKTKIPFQDQANGWPAVSLNWRPALCGCLGSRADLRTSGAMAVLRSSPIDFQDVVRRPNSNASFQIQRFRERGDLATIVNNWH
jgi:hypothetical protein